MTTSTTFPAVAGPLLLDGERLDYVTAYSLAGLADCETPDSPSSPGAEFLCRVRDAVAEAVEFERRRCGLREALAVARANLDDAVDGTLSVLTWDQWRTFVDLGAWSEVDAEAVDGVDFDDSNALTEMAERAVYVIGRRLAAALLDESDGIAETVAPAWLDAALPHYLTAALWSSLDDEGAGLDDRYGVDDFAPEAIEAARDDLRDFALFAEVDLVDMDPAQVGHDLWLTRNHHGAGFWDRGLGDRGDRLTEAAQDMGSADVLDLDGVVTFHGIAATRWTA